MEIADDTHAELMNWATWCHSGAFPHPLPPTVTGSLESGYRAPPQWDDEDQRRSPVIRPNEHRARIVQSAWEQLSGWPRITLKAEYPGMLEARRVLKREDAARRLGLTIEWYEHHLEIAVRKVEEELAVRA